MATKTVRELTITNCAGDEIAVLTGDQAAAFNTEYAKYLRTGLPRGVFLTDEDGAQVTYKFDTDCIFKTSSEFTEETYTPADFCTEQIGECPAP